MRFLPLLSLALIATGSLVMPASPRPAIEARPIMLDPSDPGNRRVGGLRFLAGWELRSPRSEFGGISSMHVKRGRVLALSDAGHVFRFALDDAGNVADVRFGKLPAGPGTGEKKEDRDSESLTLDPATGRLWVGFERANAIWRYAAGFAREEAHVEPDAMRPWPWNGGPESLLRLRDGRFILICEDPTGSGDLHEALLFGGDPTAAEGGKPARFTYLAPEGFRVTDATQLPDGRIMILHRDFSLRRGVRAALSIVGLDAIRPGAVVEGKVVARFDAPLTLDNMEALSAESVGGKTILWLASDDNFNPLQRTLLMKFELAGE